MNKPWALLLVAVAALSCGVLLSGPALAEYPLPGGLPLGNLLMALCLCGLSGAAWLLSAGSPAQRRFAAMALLASLLWLPGSALLAGNLALNFSGTRGTAWLLGSVAVMAAALVAFAWAMVGCAVHRLRRP